MEFRFNVNEIFKQPIVEINSSLIPPGLSLADKRALWDAVSKVSDVVNAMGEASAAAQGLTKPITTSERLRNSEHKLYMLIDQNANNGKGVVTGMLKTGKKGLYVFDRDGHHYQVQPACVLDFYVHESKQRMGLGKKLFEYMLEKEQVEPVRMAIDRPSDKFLGFLNKHYALDNPVKQMNNFVVFDGFFPEPSRKDEVAENNNTPLGKSNQSANGLQTNYTSPYGRYGAPRPPCSMGQIIHNQSPLIQQNQEPAGTSLNIRAPNKTRSIYSSKQEIVSNGTQKTSERTSNAWNPNQNSEPPQFQNSLQTGNNNNWNSQNQNFQYQPFQNQIQQYPNQDIHSNINPQQQYSQPYNSYNQNQYTVQSHPHVYQQPHQAQPQNQVDASLAQNQLQNGNIYQNQQQQSQYSPNKTANNQQTIPIISRQQQQNTQLTQQSAQNLDVQSPQKRSVQFHFGEQNTQEVNYQQPTQSQSTYEQRFTQQQLTCRPSQTTMQTTDNTNSIQYVQQTSVNNIPQARQERQNVETTLSQHQNMQNPDHIQYRQTIPNIQQTYPQQPRQAMYQPQQLDRIIYQPQQSQQTIYQPEQLQPTTYSQQSPQTEYQREPQQSQQIAYQPQAQQEHAVKPMFTTQEHVQQNIVQRPETNVGKLESPQNVSLSNYNYPNQNKNVSPSNYNYPNQNVTTQIQRNNEVPNQIHPTEHAVNQRNQQHNVANTSSAHYQLSTPNNNVQSYNPTQNPQNPQNYHMNLQQPVPMQNMENYQQSLSPSIHNVQQTNQMQYSQQNVNALRQAPSQVQQQVNASTIIPPVEAVNKQMHKNYTYYDSNTGGMQSTVGENIKQIPANDVTMIPNASGDMQPIGQ